MCEWFAVEMLDDVLRKVHLILLGTRINSGPLGFFRHEYDLVVLWGVIFCINGLITYDIGICVFFVSF